jgi:DNA-binding CsgD family transcriptional regulator
MIQNNKHRFVTLFLCFIITCQAYSQTQTFDSIANKLNRISNSKKTESLELLDKLYQIAYNHPDSSLLLARCLYEESILNVYQGIVDTSMFDRIQVRLNRSSYSPLEHALLQSALAINQLTIKLKSKQVTIIVIVSGFTILLILMFLLLINQQKLRKASENRELTAKLEHEQKVQQYKKRQQQLEIEKQKEVLDAKTREITSYSMLVSTKNNLLKHVMEISAQAVKNQLIMKKSLTKIEEIINNNLSVDEEWENFKLHFDKVHPDFFKKLKRKCGSLTEENLRMSAYIKLGMTTKQIAQMLNIADSSVLISRHRIKKKLKLPDKESLSRFIGSL